MGGWVYIMASGPYGTLYVGVTNNIARRVHEHREGGRGFCHEYGVKRLVHLEKFELIQNAIHREKRLKTWPRRWKINLIEQSNPRWEDLHERINW